MFVLDNQMPGPWDVAYFVGAYRRSLRLLAKINGWTSIHLLLHVVTDRAFQWPGRGDSDYSNPLWCGDQPGISRDNRGRVMLILSTWYALRRLQRTLPGHDPVARISKWACRVLMFSATCTHASLAEPFTCAVYASRRFIFSGGGHKGPVLPGCKWDGSMRVVKGTLPRGIMTRDVSVLFMHCIRYPRVKFLPRVIGPGTTIINAERYGDGAWTSLSPLPPLLQPMPMK